MTRRHVRPAVRAFATLSLLAVAACSASSGPAGIPVPTPQLPPADALLERADLQAVVDLQVLRDGEAIEGLLTDQDAAVRARAALALASVQDPRAEPTLQDRLDDEDPSVRRNAAFALGQIPLTDGGAALLVALEGEEDPAVRRSLLEALGKRGGFDSVLRLVEWTPGAGDEAAWTLALARAGLRELRGEGLVDRLVAQLTSADADVRRYAAYFFGRAGNAGPIADAAPGLRAALDTYPWDEPAAMDILVALGRIGEVETDAARISAWLTSATDWRTRINATSVVTNPRWLENQVIRDAVVVALDDPSGHVRVQAANALALLAWSSEEELARAAELVEGSVERWRSQAPFLQPLAGQERGDLVVAWLRRMVPVHPAAVTAGISAIGGVVTPEANALLLELTGHPAPTVRAAAVTAVSQRWGRGVIEATAEEVFETLAVRLEDSENLPVTRAAFALTHPEFQELGAAELIEAAFRGRESGGDMNALGPLIESMGESSIPLLRELAVSDELAVRAAAARALVRLTGDQVPVSQGDEPDPPTIDWAGLGELGSEPRIRIATEHGDIVVRLYVEQAPLSVQNLVRQIRAGEHDGTRFHRVVANFVAQGGDFGMGDGTGNPGYRIRTEITQLDFARGVLGMASAGKDTEGSQYYLAHSMQPHLDGGYTAFGWIEEGGGVLDRIQQGDLILEVTIED